MTAAGTAASTPPGRATSRASILGLVTLLAMSALVAGIGPYPVTAGVARMAGWVVLTAGVGVLVARTGTVDLSTAATAAIGAYVGAVALPLAGVPAVVGVLVAAIVGALSGAANGALAGRLGGHLAALPTLSIGLAVVAVIRAWPGSGGAAGYHAAPFLTGGETTDAVAVVALAGVALAAVARWWPSRGAARASVGAREPAALAALGVHPAAATAAAGGLAGALLGAGAAAQAMVSGSVTPGAFGLGLAAALALAAHLGGGPPWGPLVGAGWLWGPSVLFPLAPVVGDAPVLLTTGVAGLAVLALRRGRPLVRGPSPRTARQPTGHPPGATAGRVTPAHARLREEGPPTRAEQPPVLEVPATQGHDALVAGAGEVVALVGANGAGKSTLLARMGGQLPDPVGVRLHGRPAPRGAVARARAGIGRTWQQPLRVPRVDLVAAAVGTDDGGEDAGQVNLADLAAVPVDHGAHGDPWSAQLSAALLTRPDVVLLDEPAAAMPEAMVVEVVTALAGAGIAVVLVDHRPEVVAVADRRCVVTSPDPRGEA